MATNLRNTVCHSPHPTSIYDFINLQVSEYVIRPQAELAGERGQRHLASSTALRLLLKFVKF